MILKLHYAPLILNGDIKCYEFKNSDEVDKFIFEKLYNDEFMPRKVPRKVILINIEDEIFITDNFNKCNYLIESFISWMCYDFDIDEDCCDIINMYLQEYYSYEEAYKVALSMKETNPLCFDTIHKLSKN